MINFRFKYRLNASLKYLNVSLDYLFIVFFVFPSFRISCDEVALSECKSKGGSSFLMIGNGLNYCKFYGFDLRCFNRTVIYDGNIFR